MLTVFLSKYNITIIQKVSLIITETTVFSLSKQTPMHTAAKEGNEYTMKGLVKLGAAINIKDKNGVSETF